MDEIILNELKKEIPSPFHNALLEHCKGLLKMSRDTMCMHYPTWDRHDAVYRGVRWRDKEDTRAAERSEPEKMIVPMSYAQIQTFIAFCFAVFFQRRRVYELIGANMNDHKAAKVAEAFLARDLEYNNFTLKLYQFLLDISRFGVGVIKHGWVRETQWVEETVKTPPATIFGLPIPGAQPRTDTTKVEKTKYLGNKLFSISPYRFYPDVRLPLSRFQEGEFCGSEDEYSYTELKQMEHEGLIAGMKWVPTYKSYGDTDSDRNRFQRFNNIAADLKGGGYANASQSKQNVILTEVQVKLIPKEFKINGEQTLGEEEYPVKYLVWIANDIRVVRCEPLDYPHDCFTYCVGELSPDQNRLINEGLSGLIAGLQDLITWTLNARVTDVRKNIHSKYIVDETGIETKDIVERRPYIRLKKVAARSGVDKWIKQIETQDVTKGHIQDIDSYEGILQVVTGINDNILGQFNSGRRSAREAGNVAAGATGRLKVPVMLLWSTALKPLGEMLLSNLRNGVDEETYVRVIGPEVLTDLQAYNGFIMADKSKLAGNYDFEIFDGTLPSEKDYLADTLLEWLQALIANPESIPMLGWDPQKLSYEVAVLKGVRNPEQFMLDQLQIQKLVQLQQLMANPQGPGANYNNEGTGLSAQVETAAASGGAPNPAGIQANPMGGGPPQPTIPGAPGSGNAGAPGLSSLIAGNAGPGAGGG